MAVKKATTRADLEGKSPEDVTAAAVDLSPTSEDILAGVEENTSKDVLADVDQPKSVKLKSPAGSVTEVPESIVDALVESGYSKTK